MVYVFEDYKLDTGLMLACRSGVPVRLRPKAFRLLVYLIEHRDFVLSKQCLCEAVWPGRVISDATLDSTVRAIRQALNDAGRTHHIVQTVHGCGYRFIAAVGAERHRSGREAVPAGSDRRFSLPPAAAEDCGADERPPPMEPTREVFVPRAALIKAGDSPSLTVLFCDFRDMLCEGRALAETLDGVLYEMIAVCRAIAESRGGYLAQVVSDGLWVYFGYPQCRDDAPSLAIASGLDMTDAIGCAHASFVRRFGVAPSVRVAIHAGPSRIVALDGLYPLALGPVPVITARLLSRTVLGSVTVSGALLPYVDDMLSCEMIGTVPGHASEAFIRAYRVRRAAGHAAHEGDGAL